MADDVDIANERAETVRQNALQHRKPVAPNNLSCRCLNDGCMKPVPKGVRWCSASCRDEWEEENA